MTISPQPSLISDSRPVKIDVEDENVAQPTHISGSRPVKPDVGLLAAADWDRGTEWTVAYSDGEFCTLSRQQFYDHEYERPELEMLIVESAHLKAKTTKSKAQIYIAEQLNNWNPRVPVVMAEGRFTRIAKEYVGYADDKTKDAQSLVFYMRDFPKVLASCKHFVAPEDEEDFTFRNTLRDSVTDMLNALRDEWTEPKVNKYEIPAVEHCCKLLEKCEIPDSVAAAFEIKLLKAGPRKGKLSFNVSQVMTAYCCLFDEKQNPRLQQNGEVLGTGYILKKLIELHMVRRGGILRSNFVHHGMRHKCVSLDITKAEYGNAVKKLLQLLRKQVVPQPKLISDSRPVKADVEATTYEQAQPSFISDSRPVNADVGLAQNLGGLHG